MLDYGTRLKATIVVAVILVTVTAAAAGVVPPAAGLRSAARVR